MKIFSTVFVINICCPSPLLKEQHSFEFYDPLQKIKMGKFFIPQKMMKVLLNTKFIIQIVILNKEFYPRQHLFNSALCTKLAYFDFMKGLIKFKRMLPLQ